jgi:ribosomal-protein-alanine N-acetyltransferase
VADRAEHRLTAAVATAGTALRSPRAADEAEFIAAVRRSRTLHRPWVSAPDTPERYATWLDRMQPPSARSFFAIDKTSGALAGVFNISQIVRGPLQSAYLGYYAFAGSEGKGHMTRALQAVLRVAFGELKLHRLEANIQPGDARSIALVQRCGFEREGFSPRYLKIGGRWRDHERWAILRD